MNSAVLAQLKQDRRPHPLAGQTKAPKSLRLKANRWILVEPIHCHQRLAANTLVAQLRKCDKDAFMVEALCKVNPEGLTFFFDHEIDHIPGMVQVNMFRQAALAFAHLVYGVPINWLALLDWMGVRLLNYGELNTKTILRFRLQDLKVTKHRMELSWDGVLLQDPYPIMSARGKCVMLSPELGKQVRFRKTELDMSSGFIPKEWLPSI